MKTYKKFALCFIILSYLLSLLGGVAFCALLLAYDPFWFFHKPIFREQSFMRDMRVAARGYIERFEFDGLILGTSVMENMSANEANATLGGKWINLSLSGGSFYERSFLLKFAIKTKPIKRVIYSVDAFSLVNEHVERDKRQSAINPRLYESFALREKIKYLFERKFVDCALKWSTKPECVGEKVDFDKLLNFYDGAKHTFFGFASWWEFRKNDALTQLKREQKAPYKLPFDSTSQKAYVEKYLLEIIAQNPQIEFHLILPTYQRWFYKFPTENLYNEGRQGRDYHQIWLEMISWFVREIKAFENAKIYGFDDLDYADNLLNYQDGVHHKSDLNSMQIQAIATNSQRVNADNLEKYLAFLNAKINDYKLTPLINEIKIWEREKAKKEAKK